MNKDLYVIQTDITGAIKIGISNNPKRRLRQLQTGSPFPDWLSEMIDWDIANVWWDNRLTR